MTNNNGYTGMNMLVVTTDPSLSSAFREEANEIGVEAQTSGNFSETHQRFEAAKYKAVVVDFDTFPDSDLVIASIRESRCSKNAVVFAVATNRRHMEQALQRRAHFVLNRPLEASALKRTLRVAYDLMLKDRRRYSRCATVLPIRVRIVRTQNILQCLSINVSSNGMAINAPESLKLAETLEIEFALSGGFQIRATGFVVWDDKHGKSGINFQCVGPEMRQKLDSWLGSQFNNQLRTGPLDGDLSRAQLL